MNPDGNNLHIHFGAGKLGIGAVLPTLNPKNPLIVVQKNRFEGFSWEAIALQERVLLSNSTGIKLEQGGYEFGPYRKWFRCFRKAWREGIITTNSIPFLNDDSPLLIVDHFNQITPFLNQASSVSCSLGLGQAELAEVLSECKPKSNNICVLAFENTLNKSLKDSVQWPVLHVITDRICSQRKLLDSNRNIWVENEEYLSMVSGAKAESAFNPNLVGKGKPIKLVPNQDLKFIAFKKRALVNSLHQLLATLCFRALSEEELPTGGQYLPVVMAWFAKEHPDFHHAIELYKRLRALQLVWPILVEEENQSVEIRCSADAAKRFYNTTEPQQIYDAMLLEGQLVVDRFNKAPDELSRLINPRNLRKELRSYREHILEPMHFMWANEDEIKACPLYEKPNFSDLVGLEEILTESFLMAMDKAMRVEEQMLNR